MYHLVPTTTQSFVTNESVFKSDAYYDEFIRRATAEEKKEIERMLEELTDVEYQLSHLLKNLMKNLHTSEFPYYALLAFKKGLLTDQQLGTFLLFWDACNYKAKEEKFESSICPLFGDLNYSELVFANLGNSDQLSPTKKFLLTEEQQMEWIEEMKKLPKSEQRFLLLSQPVTKGKMNILHALENTGFNVFWNRGSSKWMIPSVGMMQAYINVKFGSNAVRIRPVIGSSSLKDLRSNFEVRDMACRFPGVALTEYADYYSAPGPSFALHDFYHCVMASFIPLVERELIGATRDIIFATSKQVQETDQVRSLKHICFVLIDMEHPSYSISSLARDAYWVMLGVLFLRPILTNRALETLSVFSDAAKKVRPYAPLEKHVEELALRNLCRELMRSNLSLDLMEQLKQTKRSVETYKQFVLPVQLDTSFQGQFLRQIIEKRLENSIPMTFEFYDRLEAIYKEEKGANVDFLDALKKSFLENNHPKQALEEFLPYLNPKNAVSLFRFSMQHLKECRALVQKCMQYIAEHFFDSIETEEFKAYISELPKEISLLLKRIKASSQFRVLFNESMMRFKRDGSCEALNLFLGSHIDVLDAYGFTMLDYAVEANQLDVTQLLLKRGAHPNPMTGSKAIPTAFAALEVGNYAIYKLLLEKGFNTRILYNNQRHEDRLMDLMVDPSRFGGIVLHVNRESQKSGYAFSNDEFILWCNAQRAKKDEELTTNEEITAWAIRKE